MIYKVIGTMSGSSMDGLDIVYSSLQETGGKWSYEILESACVPFSTEWQIQLAKLTTLSAKDLLLAHSSFGLWMANAIAEFIHQKDLQHKVHLIASHGHTVFHAPNDGMTFQLGDGAIIAAVNHLPVVSDLRNMDIALGGQGAPIIPIGEKLLWSEFKYFLNIGGICNLSIFTNDQPIAMDVCAANRVLNLLSNELGLPFDEQGREASKGAICNDLLDELNDMAYYQMPAPKSLANEFGTDVIFQIVQKYPISIHDKLYTYCEHIALQISSVCGEENAMEPAQMLISGGGAYNDYLVDRLRYYLSKKNIQIVIPSKEIVDYKEALVMALIGALRWREEINVLSSATGSTRNSVGGALWMGQD